MKANEFYRKLKPVDEILLSKELIEKTLHLPRWVVVKGVQNVLHQLRECIKRGEVAYLSKIDFSIDFFVSASLKEIERLTTQGLNYVINATGTVLHTNLGRAPLSDRAISAITTAAQGYTNLEMDIETGKRNQRGIQAAELLKLLTNTEDALIVNNNAAAVLLILSTFSTGREVIVSRGEQVEVGGSFRIPDVMKSSGTTLVEVGATNKTKIEDYEAAITENTAALMKIHTSNFVVLGFTHETSLDELVDLGRKYNLPVIHDLGSGSFVDFSDYGLPKEPLVLDSLNSGADIICFSGDKLLGATQAGIILGKKKYINELRKNQLLRALRVDKLTLAGLSETLNSYLDVEKAKKEIPTLKMLTMSYEKTKIRATALKELIERLCPSLKVRLVDTHSSCGGGAMPISDLKSCVLALAHPHLSVKRLAEELRFGENPIVSRLHNESLYLDTRTLKDDDFEIIATKLSEICR